MLLRHQSNTPPATPSVLNPSQVSSSPINGNAGHQSSSANNVMPVNEPPSYASTMAFKASQQQPRFLPPPPCMCCVLFSLSLYSLNYEFIVYFIYARDISIISQSRKWLHNCCGKLFEIPMINLGADILENNYPAQNTVSEAINNVFIIPYGVDLSNSPDVLGISLTPPLPPTSSTSVKAQSGNSKGHNFSAGVNDAFMAASSTSSAPMITAPKTKSTEKKLSKQPTTAPPNSNKSVNNNHSDDSNNNINYNNKNQRGATKNNKKSDTSIRNESPKGEKKGTNKRYK